MSTITQAPYCETRRGSRDVLIPSFTLALAALVAASLYGMAKALSGSEAWSTPADWLWVLLPAAAAFFGCLLVGGSRLPILNEARPTTLAVGYMIALLICGATAYVSHQNADRRQQIKDRKIVEESLRQQSIDNRNREATLAKEIADAKAKQSAIEQKLTAAEKKAAAGDPEARQDVEQLKQESADNKKSLDEKQAELEKLRQEYAVITATVAEIKKQTKVPDEDEPPTKPETKPETDPKPQPAANPDGKDEKDDGIEKFVAGAVGLLMLVFPELMPLLALLPALFSMGTENEDLRPIFNAAQSAIHAGDDISPDKFVEDFVKNNQLKNPETAKKALATILSGPFVAKKLDETTRERLKQALEAASIPEDKKPTPEGDKPPAPPQPKKPNQQAG